MMADMSIPVTYDVNGSGNGGGMFGTGGGSEMWIFFLFFLLLAGGGGGFGLGGNSAAANAISNDFLYSNLNGQIKDVAAQNVALGSSLSSGLCSLGYESLGNFKDVQAQLAANAAAAAACCCETNRNIDNVKFEALQNTSAIIQAGNANTQAILDKMCQNEIQALRDKVLTLENNTSNLIQQKAIVEQLRPYPTPAYVVSSPYGVGNNGNCFC